MTTNVRSFIHICFVRKGYCEVHKVKDIFLFIDTKYLHKYLELILLADLGQTWFNFGMRISVYDNLQVTCKLC